MAAIISGLISAIVCLIFMLIDHNQHEQVEKFL